MERCTHQTPWQKVFFDYYDGLLGTEWTWSHTLNLTSLGIEPRDLSDLETPFTEEEVWHVIKGLPPDKLPGLDGMTAAFY